MPHVFRLTNGFAARRFYSIARRPYLKQQNPDWTFGEFGKAIGAEWGQMTDKQKTRYVALNETDKMRFDREMENYDPPSEEEEDTKKGKRKKKDPNAPKRACSAFMCVSPPLLPEPELLFRV